MDALPQIQKPAARSKEEKATLTRQWRASGKDKTTFCRENKINYMTFIGWTCTKKKEKTKPSFIPLEINPPAVFAELSLRGAKIIFHSPVSAQFLKTLLK
jgi:hypothetical protein